VHEIINQIIIPCTFLYFCQ